MYSLRLLDRAQNDLASLDRAVARRIAQKLRWLVENIEGIRREPLTGDFSNFLKFRIGDYRIIYQVLDGEKTIVVYEIGHRRKIYKGK